MSERLDIQRNTSLSQQTTLDKTIAAGISPGAVYFISDTTERTDLSGYYAIQAVEDTEFTSITAEVASGSNTISGLAGITMSAGHIWYLKVTGVELASGKVLMYKI